MNDTPLLRFPAYMALICCKIMLMNAETVCLKYLTRSIRLFAVYGQMMIQDWLVIILKHNILCGDALTLKTSAGHPIAFAEWSAVNSCFLKRRDFRLDQMLEGHEQQYTLDMINWTYDEEVKAYLPLPFREFPPVHYKKVQQYE